MHRSGPRAKLAVLVAGLASAGGLTWPYVILWRLFAHKLLCRTKDVPMDALTSQIKCRGSHMLQIVSDSKTVVKECWATATVGSWGTPSRFSYDIGHSLVRLSTCIPWLVLSQPYNVIAQ